MLFNEDADIAHFDLVNSRTCPMKFKDFQAPALFSSTFKTLNLGEKIQGLSRMRGNPEKDCQARNLNREDAMDCSRWKNLIKTG